MRIRQVDNALDLFELFARERAPLTLTEIASALDMPKSSAFNLIDTLLSRGLIYETRHRGGYYPTPRLYEIFSAVMEGDPFLQRIHGELERLSLDTGETVLLSARQGDEIVYIDVVESAAVIRYSAHYGQKRPLHATSTGRAILLTYSERERAEIVASIDYPAHHTNVAMDAGFLLGELAASAARGYTVDRATLMADVIGIAVPLVHGSRRFGLGVAGPLYRMDPQREELANHLKSAAQRIQSMMRNEAS